MPLVSMVPRGRGRWEFCAVRLIAAGVVDRSEATWAHADNVARKDHARRSATVFAEAKRRRRVRAKGSGSQMQETWSLRMRPA